MTLVSIQICSISLISKIDTLQITPYLTVCCLVHAFVLGSAVVECILCLPGVLGK